MNHAQDNYQHVYRLKNKSKINLGKMAIFKMQKKTHFKFVFNSIVLVSI